MPMASILPNGGTAYSPCAPSLHQRTKRGSTCGWTLRASKGNRRFLWSVISDRLGPGGHAVTLTVRHCPPSPEHWAKLRNAWLRRLERSGLVRIHWVTEWQRRGVPHMHCAIWLPPGLSIVSVLRWWCDIATDYAPVLPAQHHRPISGPVGWFEYLAKHSARSARNYQRSGACAPRAWAKSGRVWGYRGDWPLSEPALFELSGPAYFAYRRQLLRWQISCARCRRDFRRVAYLRRYLQVSEEHSAKRGVGDWVPDLIQLGLLHGISALVGGVRPLQAPQSNTPRLSPRL